MNTILQKIVKYKKKFIKENIVYYKELKKHYKDDFITYNNTILKYLAKDFTLIAEAKKGSPSAGIINPNFNPSIIAETYEKCDNVSAVSVLTDEKYFFGSKQDFKTMRKIVSKPMLRKDFIISAYQIYETKVINSDILLLIAEILTEKQIIEFYKLAKKFKLDVIVEVHSIENVNKVYNCINPEIIGINNRNLNDFSVDINNTFKIKKYIEDNYPLPYIISESGIKSNKEIQFLKENKINGVLVGTSIMSSNNIESGINKLMS